MVRGSLTLCDTVLLSGVAPWHERIVADPVKSSAQAHDGVQ